VLAGAVAGVAAGAVEATDVAVLDDTGVDVPATGVGEAVGLA
jgi:hypothetical protein